MRLYLFNFIKKRLKKPCNQCFNPETAAGNQLKNKNYEKNFTNVSC